MPPFLTTIGLIHVCHISCCFGKQTGINESHVYNHVDPDHSIQNSLAAQRMVPVRETTPFIQPSKFGRVRQHTSINDTETRIVGGNPADLGEYPSFAFAVGGTLCGG
jgi:hypothetical protein